MNRLMTLRVGGLAGAAALAAATALVPTAASPTANAEEEPPPDATECRVLTDEHVDAINVGLDGQQLTVNSKIGPPTEYAAADELIFQLSDLGLVEGLPENYAEFIGASVAWVTPQAQNPQVLWPGWSTEAIGAGEVDADTVDITLADVEGPGDVEVWQTVGFGDVRRIFSSDEDHKTLTQGVNAHVHANWAFTQPGVYTLAFAASATVDGEPVESGPVEYTWVVGGEPGELPAPKSSATVLDVPSSVEPGEEVSLGAYVGTDITDDAPPEPSGHVEFRDGGESLGWTRIDRGRADLAVAFDELGEHTITARYVPREPQFYTGSDATPATVVVEEQQVPATTLSVSGPDGVEAGQHVTLTATQDPPTELDHYHWFAKEPGASEFEVVAGEFGEELTFTADADADGTRYRAVLYTDEHEEVASSEPYTLHVGDAGEPGETTLTIDGLAGHYHSGDTIELTAVQDPETGLEHYHWFGKFPGEDEFVEVGGGATLTAEASPELDGAQYRVELYGEDHEVVAASEPVTIVVDDHGDPPGDEDGHEDPPGDEDPPDACEDPRTVLTDEHTDLLAPVLDGADLRLRTHVGSATGHADYDPSDVLVQVKDPEAGTEVPGGDEYAFLGEPGDALWVIPQAQNPDVVWAGWSTEELATGAFEGDAVEMTLTGVEGPGIVEVFQSGGLDSAPERIFSSQDDLEPFTQSVGQHVHSNWAFGELGEYTLTFEVSGTLTDGTEVSTGEVDYAFVVGEPDCDPGGGDETGGDGGTDTGGDAGGDDSGGDQSGTADGTDAGGDGSDGAETGSDGTDAGTDAGDATGTATGDVSGYDGTGNADGTGFGATTLPVGDVCPAGTVPAGQRSGPGETSPSATVSPDAEGDGGADGAGGSGGSGDAPDDTPTGEQVVLSDEHVDLLSPRLDGAELSLRTAVGSANDHADHDPADVLVHVKPQAQSTVPDGDAHGFLGDAGDPLWLIPETQDPQIVWAGWSTEQLSPGDLRGDTVDMRMVDVTGPGTVEVFQTTGFGDVNRIFSSTDSLGAREQSVGRHVHANWAFSAEGEYTVTFEVTGALPNGEAVTTGPVEFSFVVGELSGTAAAAGAAGAAGAVGGVAAASSQTLPVTGTTQVSASADEDCVLASTGTSGVGDAAGVAGALLLLGTAAALYAYRRRGVAPTGGEQG